MFITFEGIDFSGKSTQAKFLYEYFKKLKRKVILVREPGGTYISEKIREILLDKDNHNMKFLTEFLLFSASRQQLVKEVIIPHLKKKFIVICDRYYDSSTAYQGYGGNLNIKYVDAINKIATDSLDPDITFLLNINYKESIQRKRLAKIPGDRIEQKKIEYYKKVIKGYLEIGEKHKRVKIVDGRKPAEILRKEILSVINKNFKSQI